MFPDNTGLPAGGGPLIAALLYIGASMYATGPLLGERLIEKSNWQAHCQTAQRSRMTASQPKPQFQPRLDCRSLFGWFGKDGEAFCQRYGGQFKLPFQAQIDAHRKRLESYWRKRFTSAASKINSQCDCAAAVVLEKRRTDFAIHAGSLRLITPLAIRNLDAELNSALFSPQCAMKGE